MKVVIKVRHFTNIIEWKWLVYVCPALQNNFLIEGDRQELTRQAIDRFITLYRNGNHLQVAKHVASLKENKKKVNRLSVRCFSVTCIDIL